VNTMKGILVLGVSGPLLLLSSYPAITDPELLLDLEARGHRKFVAWEVPLERCHDLYGFTYRDEHQDLEAHQGVHVLDADGHRIFVNFSLHELSGGIVYEDGKAAALR